MIKIIRVCYHFLAWISPVRWMQQFVRVLLDVSPFSGLLREPSCQFLFLKRWKRMQIQRKGTSLQSQKKRRPSDPRIFGICRVRQHDVDRLRLVVFFLSRKTIGKCSDFWRTVFVASWPSVPLWRRTRKSLPEVVGFDCPSCFRNRCCWLIVTSCHFSKHLLPPKHGVFLWPFFWCYISGVASRAAETAGQQLLQGDRPKLERSLTQNLEEPKAKSKAVRMKVGPRICQWILWWEMSGR